MKFISHNLKFLEGLNMKKSNLKAYIVFLLIFVLTFGGVPPVFADGDIVGGAAEDISGNASVFVFRKGKKTPHARRTSTKKFSSNRNRQQKTSQYAKFRARLKDAVAKKRAKSRVSNNSTQVVAAKTGTRPTTRRTAPTPKNVQTLIDKGDAALASGDSATAIQSYTKALAASPKNQSASAGLSDALTAKADAAAAAGNAAQAIANYEEALKHDRQNEAAYAGLGEVYDTLDQQAKAIANFQKALQLDATLVDIYYPLGVLYYETKDYAKAENYLSKALPARADDAETRYYVGLVNARLQRDAEAVQAFQLASELKPDYAEAYFNLGESLDRLNQTEDAIKAYQKALSVNPKYADAWHNLGVAYYNRERYAESAAAYKQAAAINGDVDTNLNLADSYRQMKQFDSANVAYENAIAKNTDAPAEERAEVYEKYAYCLGKANRWENSVVAANESSKLNPDSVTYSNLSWTYSNSAKVAAKNKNEEDAKLKLEESKKAAEKASELDAKNEAAKFNLGNAQTQLGEYPEAVQSYSSAITLRSDWAEAYNGLGVAYRLSGDLDNAAEASSESLRLNNDSADAHLNMAIVETGRGNKKEAKRHRDEVKRLNPALAATLDIFMKNVAPALIRRGLNKIPGKRKLDAITYGIPLPF